MRKYFINRLAEYRERQKRRREARLAAAHARVEKRRELEPLPQAQLELNDAYVSKREHDLQVLSATVHERTQREWERYDALVPR